MLIQMGWEHNKYFKDCEKVLDAGCGFAEMMESFPDKVIGVDNDSRVIKWAESRGYNVVNASVLELPFEDCHFDGVISSHVIEHMLPRDAIKMMHELSRVLKRGGILMLRTPVFDKEFYKMNIDHIKPYPPKAIKLFIRDYPELNLKMESIIYDFKFPFHDFVHWLFNKVVGKKKDELKQDVATGRGSSFSKLMAFTHKLAKIPFMRSGYTMILRKC